MKEYVTINPTKSIASILACIGAINWGIVGIYNINGVTYLLGEGSSFAKIVYTLIGVSGMYLLILLGKDFPIL